MTNPPTDYAPSSQTNSRRSFQSAKSYLERHARSDRAPSSDEEFNSERQSQLELMASWAEGEGKLIDPSRWTTPGEMGAEHRVYLDADRVCAVKITNTGKCGMTYRNAEPASATPQEYLTRWILQNEIFGDDAWLEGVVRSPSGICLAVGQKWITGTVPDSERILVAMNELGFEPGTLPESYYRREDDIAVMDCHEGNFILGYDDILYPIDLVVVPADESLKHALGFAV